MERALAVRYDSTELWRAEPEQDILIVNLFRSGVIVQINQSSSMG